MKIINQLGSASEFTKGEFLNSVQIDPEGVKIPTEVSVTSCTAPRPLADGVAAHCPG